MLQHNFLFYVYSHTLCCIFMFFFFFLQQFPKKLWRQHKSFCVLRNKVLWSFSADTSFWLELLCNVHSYTRSYTSRTFTAHRRIHTNLHTNSYSQRATVVKIFNFLTVEFRVLGINNSSMDPRQLKQTLRIIFTWKWFVEFEILISLIESLKICISLFKSEFKFNLFLQLLLICGLI